MHNLATLPLLLKELRLKNMFNHWEALAKESRDKGLSHEIFLSRLCELEVSERYTNRVKMYTKESKLPAGKNLATFDFIQAKNINKAQVESLAQDAQWTHQAENILIFGASGVGKTHLAAAIGHSLIGQGQRVYFTDTSKLVQQLQMARKEYRLPQALSRLSKFQILILDDVGYAKKDEAETSVLFDLIADRYETGSLIITANQPFSEWDKIFPDNMMAVAAIDRLVHHATIIKIEADSYRKTHAQSQEKTKGGKK
jgi:DNA replication protein DnaC